MNEQNFSGIQGFLKNERTVGMTANLLFLVLLLFPFISVNRTTMHSGYRFLIWAGGIAALCLRIIKKEKLAVIASLYSLIAFLIIYILLWIGIIKAVELMGAASDVKVHMGTGLLLLLSSILMFRPSLLSRY